MSSEKSLTPQIRFKGFTEAWEQRKLGELMEVTSVRRVHQDDWTTQGVRFLRARDLVAYANNTEIELPLYISKELYEKYTTQSGKVEIGDLLVTGVGTIGVPWLVETPSPVYFKDGNIIWFKNKNAINGKYFYYAFTSTSIQKFIKESAGTGTVGTYTIDTGKKTPIYIPSTFEQHKIASAMKRFDSLITLHQRKLDALKKIKSALLEKMFPKDGSNIPEIRFTGFTEAWEQRKLGDVAAFSKGQGFSKSDLTESGSPVILYGRLYTNYETVICKVDTFVKKSSSGVLSKGGEVIIPASGETAEDIAVASYVSLPGILLGGDLNVVTPKYNLDSSFLALFITFGNAHAELSKLAQGKSVVHVHNSDLSQLNVNYPTYPEQTLISNLFIKNDNLITLHQRKLDALKKIKSALLEKMFV